MEIERGGVLKSGQSTGVTGEPGGNKNNPPKIAETERMDSDGTLYTNYSLNYKNDSGDYAWPNFQLLTYSYELNHTYQVEFDIRINVSSSGFGNLHIRHGACVNDYASPETVDIDKPSGWERKTMTRTFDSETMEHSGVTTKVSPTIELYSTIIAGNTGIFDFDIKNVTVYDVTAQKYVTSNDSNVKAGTTLVVGDSDSTVTAVWAPNKLTLNCYPNGATKVDNSHNCDGTGIIEVDPNKITRTEVFNYDVTLPSYGLCNANRFIREGYETNNLYHAGSPDSKVMLDADDNVYAKTQDLAKAAGVLPQLEKGDVTLNIYAHWEPAIYTNTISHWIHGFENKEGNNDDKTARLLRTTTFKKIYGEKLTYTTADAITLPNGFSLSGIVGSASYEGNWTRYSMGTSFTQPAKATNAEYDYFPITYTITYNLNGGALLKANPSTYNVLYGVDFANEPVRSGYKFLGWYIEGKKVTGINVGCNATFTSADDLYAKLATRTTGNQTVETKWEKLTDITITNTVSGNMGNKSKDFAYTIQLPSSFNGTKLTIVDASGSTSTVTVGSDCKLSFTLKHGQSYTIKELNEAQFNSIKGLTNYGISEANYAEEGYKTSSTTKMDTNGNIQLIFNNQNGSVLPTGIILAGSGMGIIVVLVIALGWLIKHKFIK